MRQTDYDNFKADPRFGSGRYPANQDWWPANQDWWYMSWFHDRWLNITTLAFPTEKEGRYGIPVQVMYIVNDS